MSNREELERIFIASRVDYHSCTKERAAQMLERDDEHYNNIYVEGFWQGFQLSQATHTDGEVVEIGNLILPAVEDGEYPDCDIEWDSDAAEKLQEKLVSNEDVILPIYAGGIPAPVAKVPECPYPCGWKKLYSLSTEKTAYLARSTQASAEMTENYCDAVITQGQWLKNTLEALLTATPQLEEN